MKQRLLFIFALLMLLPVSIHAQNEDLSEVNCAVLPEQILGQAHIGYAGAAHIGYAGALGDEIQDNDWALLSEDLVRALHYAQVGSDPVALIIMDDFSTVEPDTDPEDDIDWGNAAHGWLVKKVFDEMIAALPPVETDLIQLEILDIASATSFRSDLIAVELQELINTINAETGITKFVVNMSFVFVTCETEGFSHAAWLEKRQQNPNLTLIEEVGGDLEYVRDVLSDPDVIEMDQEGLETDSRSNRGGLGGPSAQVQEKLQFMRLFELSRMNSDDLRSYFRDQPNGLTIVPVASAGNFKWRRPFFPAQWPEVLSVSATLGVGPDMWSLSNNGEVSTPGAYFLFDDDVYRAGTSFAAPVVSLMVALDLTQTNYICGIANSGMPELGSNGRWNNMPLLEAVDDRC